MGIVNTKPIKVPLMCMISSILVILLVIPAAAGPETAEDRFLEEITLQRKTVHGDTLYQYNDLFLSFGGSFDDSFESSESDFGARFSVIRITGESSTVLYRSRGSGDSYILRPSFFSADIEQAPLLILAETGTEYSWGARVFLVSPDGSARDLGSLDVAVSGGPEFEEDAVSVIPHTRIKVDGNGYEFTFEKDVIFNPGGLDEHPVSRNRIKYVYDGASLNLITTGE